jgi:hypothetical protein
VRLLELLQNLADDDCAGGVRQLLELTQVLVRRSARARSLERRTHKHRTINGWRDDDGFSGN